MSDSQIQNSVQNANPISIGDGLYCKIRKVRIIYDVIDAEGNLAQKDGIRQSPNSIAEGDLESLKEFENILSSILDKLLKL